MPRRIENFGGEGGLVAMEPAFMRISTAVAVVAVAGIAAYVSYWHAYGVVRAHGESGVTARLEPAAIDPRVRHSDSHPRWGDAGGHVARFTGISTSGVIGKVHSSAASPGCTGGSGHESDG